MSYKIGRMPSLYPISKYRLVHKKAEKTEENVINLKAGPRAFRYAAYAAKILFEGKHKEVFLQATGQATYKVIQSVETLRHRIKGLHVAYEIKTTEFNDEYHPKEEGLEKVILNRKIHSLHATITLTESKNIESKIGYQAPLSNVFDEENFKKKVIEHFEKTKERFDQRAARALEKKERKESKIEGENAQETKEHHDTHQSAKRKTSKTEHKKHKHDEYHYENKDAVQNKDTRDDHKQSRNTKPHKKTKTSRPRKSRLP